MSSSKEVKAFLAAIPAASVVATATIIIFITVQEPLSSVNLGGLFLYLAVSIVIVAIAGFFIGIPIVWLLRHFGLMNLHFLAMSGFFAGAAVCSIILAGPGNLIFSLLVGGFSGFTASITWWVMVERRRELGA